MIHDTNRRTLLKTTGIVLAGTAFSGCLGSPSTSANAASKETNTTTTAANTADTQILVGPDDELKFAPNELTIRPDTTIEWVWKSNRHNIEVEYQPNGANWQGTPGNGSPLYDTGYTYTHTFTTEGTYNYLCTPHEAAGMTGTVTVSQSNETTTQTKNNTRQSPATEQDLPIKVAPPDKHGFYPGTNAPLTIPAGTEVPFVWKSDNHNIVVTDQPDDGNWEGTPGSTGKLYDCGYRYTHTFETPGRYEFTCYPHKALNQSGTIIVD